MPATFQNLTLTTFASVSIFGDRLTDIGNKLKSTADQLDALSQCSIRRAKR
jgi:hypothetical protein